MRFSHLLNDLRCITLPLHSHRLRSTMLGELSPNVLRKDNQFHKSTLGFPPAKSHLKKVANTFHGTVHINCWGLINIGEAFVTAVIAHARTRTYTHKKQLMICEQHPLP